MKSPARKKQSLAIPDSDAVEAIVVAEPEVGPDERLVTQAVEDLKGILRKTLTRGIEEVGSYLLNKFYGGDARAYLSTSPSKHASLSLLLQRCESLELPISRTALSNALRVAAYSRQLPKSASFHQLPPSHRVELVRVADPQRVEAMATKAVTEDLTVASLRKLVREDQPKSKTGRPRTPTPLRVLDACLRQLTNKQTQRLVLSKAEVSGLDEEDRAEVKERVATLKRRLEALEKLLA